MKNKICATQKATEEQLREDFQEQEGANGQNINTEFIFNNINV